MIIRQERLMASTIATFQCAMFLAEASAYINAIKQKTPPIGCKRPAEIKNIRATQHHTGRDVTDSTIVAKIAATRLRVLGVVVTSHVVCSEIWGASTARVHPALSESLMDLKYTARVIQDSRKPATCR